MTNTLAWCKVAEYNSWFILVATPTDLPPRASDRAETMAITHEITQQVFVNSNIPKGRISNNEVGDASAYARSHLAGSYNDWTVEEMDPSIPVG